MKKWIGETGVWSLAVGLLFGCGPSPGTTGEVRLNQWGQETYQAALPELRSELGPNCSPDEIAVIEDLWRINVFALEKLLAPAGNDAEAVAQLKDLEPIAEDGVDRLSPACKAAYLASEYSLEDFS